MEVATAAIPPRLSIPGRSVGGGRAAPVHKYSPTADIGDEDLRFEHALVQTSTAQRTRAAL